MVNIGPGTLRHTSMIFKMTGEFFAVVIFCILQKMLIFRKFGCFFYLIRYDTAIDK